MIRYGIHSLLMLVVFVCTSNAKADVLNYLPGCSNHHPGKLYVASTDEIGDYGFPKLLDIKGMVKRVLIDRYGGSEYFFDKEGRLSMMRVNNVEQTYKYDTEGRVNRITISKKESTTKNFKPFLTFSYSYFKEKNLTIATKFEQPGNVWKQSEAIIRTTEPSGNEVCYAIYAYHNADTATNGDKFILSADRSRYTRIGRTSMQNIYASAKTEKDAEAVMFGVLKDLQEVSDSVCKQVNNHSDPNALECSHEEIGKEGAFDKLIVTSDGVYKNLWVKNEWYQESLLVEEVGSGSEKLPDGKKQHTVYQYEFDSHGNWTRQTELVTESATLTNDKPSLRKLSSVSREIEYYN